MKSDRSEGKLLALMGEIIDPFWIIRKPPISLPLPHLLVGNFYWLHP
ncbi:hypothetical protein [Photobacterium damselae]